MAFPPMYAQQAKGTLMPGQMIAVNKYNVQVEKYLSQGGFAHVYLVRTAEPVFGTTHHVLKRIAVTNEAMLNDVKKEVDIMRILRGHPNIVYLIDAAWHKMPNGMFEVFILMEFCSGGGIIDMMNRRLRERLTEAEILQIFVEVSEGVAAMHNLRPPLLHRDLKIENILQSSSTSFKLCDFGSAMPVAPRPPNSTQEIRALEADLNKHTTLQYRAPEMVDVFLRRPIDEKSDVWALGVLLYKLCYYTTPFEEHGVLAILNVQYKFPPYPVYSEQLNALIASMLREHNVHRPSIFEVLDTVHKMRGSKSRFTYSPPKQPLSPRSPIPPRNATSSPRKHIESPASQPMNGIQAREKVLEAIAPMRRGRPSSPTKGGRIGDDAFNLLDSVEGGPWTARPAKAHKSGLASISTAKSPPPVGTTSSSLDDAWQVPGQNGDKYQHSNVFSGFADTFNAPASSSSPIPVPVSAPRPVPFRMNSSLKPPSGDAFESLSLFPSTKTQTMTLGEAQKAASNRPTPSPQSSSRKYSVSPSSSFQSPSPAATDNYLQKRDPSPLLAPSSSDQALAAEHRFPSLEELDANTFGTAPNSGSISAPPTAPGPSPAPPNLPPRPTARQDSSTSFYPASVAQALHPPAGLRGSSFIAPRNDGVRSQQVTGTVMRDVRRIQAPSAVPSGSPAFVARSRQDQTGNQQSKINGAAREKLQSPSRPVLVRKHRSSISIKHADRTGSKASPAEPVSGLPVSSERPKDWLTSASDGEDGGKFDDTAVLRASPEKRTSVLVTPGPPDVARAASFREVASSPVKRKPVPIDRPKPTESKLENARGEGKTTNRLGGLDENWSPLVSPKSSSSDEADEGPEDAVGSISLSKGPAQQRIGHKARQGSVHDLVDLWGGSSLTQSPKPSSLKQEKRNSVLAVASGSSAALERMRSSSPSSVLTSTATEKVSSSTPGPGASLSRHLSTASRNGPSSQVKQSPSPSKRQSASPAPSSSRSRPHSMLLPVQKSVSEMSPITVSKTSLLPPVNKARSRQRRSSISDLVSRYEAIDEQSKGTKSGALLGSAPVPAAKPARLRTVNNSSITSSDDLASPSAASARFPRISPTSSPKELKSAFPGGLDVPARSVTVKEEPQRSEMSVSPVPRSVSPSRLSSALSAKDNKTPASSAVATESSRFDRRPFNAPSPVPAARELAVPTAGSSNKDDGRHSPSPERPYQGVSKLIDQWQKKTEDTEGGKRMSGGGAGASASFKGPGSRFKREGIVAGNKFA